MSESEVLAANAAFYAAFARKDAEAMAALWAHAAPVACLHPGWEPLYGRADVVESWRNILRAGGAPPIRCQRPRVHVWGETAFVVCEEHVPGGILAATNVFVREDGQWRIAHHHASAMAPVAESNDELPN